MDQVEIRATFDRPQAAREALCKLQALRVTDIAEMPEHGLLTATVGAEVADRALHVIRQVGGNTDSLT
ncbi:hypothetical protein ACFSL6_04105 [Paenibacillus thailandensis]|uniref:Uncharacterized protein n=1 Tax=Paenibacillus thailandensis TaxID=393250 RepID=A0ABW5QZ51_9BACL